MKKAEDERVGGGEPLLDRPILLRAPLPASFSPDEMAIMAIQRLAGSGIHAVNCLVQKYKDFCAAGDHENADLMKIEMYRLAMKHDHWTG